MSDLPGGWAQASLADVADIVRGVTYDKRQASNKRRPGYLPILRATNINGDLDLNSEMVFVPEECVKPAQRMIQGDIVVASSSGSAGVVGKSAQLRTQWEGGFGAFCSVIRPRQGMNPGYLAHVVAGQRVRKAWRALAQGTNINNLKTSDLAGTVVPIPPRAEQERIVAAIEEQFSRLDAGVVALERLRSNLRRIRSALLETAVTGQLGTQSADDGLGQDLLSEIASEHQRRKVNRSRAELVTLLGNLPSNWAVARWSSIGHSQNGRAFPSNDYSGSGIKLLRPGNLHASGLVQWTVANTRYLPNRYAEEFPEYLISENEIVMNLTAQSLKDEFLGRTCMTGAGGRVLLNQRIARLSPEKMNKRFVFWVFKSPLFRRFVSQLNTGSLIQHMFTNQVDDFQLPIPPLAEQERIVRLIEAAMTGIDATENVAANAVLRQLGLRSALLAAAFSGTLVSQDQSDEPASVLLERIAMEPAGSKATAAGAPQTINRKVRA